MHNFTTAAVEQTKKQPGIHKKCGAKCLLAACHFLFLRHGFLIEGRRKPAWRQLTEMRFATIAALVARKKLGLELARYGRIADTLIKQIDNDTEALAYAQIRLAMIYSELARLGQ